MEKHNDCYFYFYSTCTKGVKCPFRHCDQALGSEVVCEAWRRGKCRDMKCPFRHMEPNINRSLIPCWFETQPQGCLKPHCVFQHNKPRPSFVELQSGHDIILPISVDNPTKQQNSTPFALNSQPEIKSIDSEHRIPLKSEINVSIERHPDEEDSDDPETMVDEIVDENVVKIKTLEQIRMEKILNSNLEHETLINDTITTKHRVSKPIEKFEHYISPQKLSKTNLVNNSFNTNSKKIQSTMDETNEKIREFQVKTLDQIRKERIESENQSKNGEENGVTKENEMPNLLKRSIDSIDSTTNGKSNSKPVKIRRNRASTTTAVNTEFKSNEMKSSNYQESNNDFYQSTIEPFSNDSDLDDFGELDMDGGLSINHTNVNDADIEDDELMREINQLFL
ncbi:hypothetical protein BLOT_007304 [Blomia tropicalis]|nr:hypothetical protein BLOT_007304 [Blomia tropicalis]